MPKGDHNKKLSDAQRLELAERYCTPLPDGTWVGAHTLARDFGIAPNAVYYHLAKLSVPTRDIRTAYANGKRSKPITNLPTTPSPLCKCGCGEATKWNRPKNRWNAYVSGHWPPKHQYKDSAWLYREYVSKQRTLKEIADQFGVSHSAVSRYAKANGIPIRDASASHAGRQVGERNPAWKGGIAKWAYSSDWKRLARDVRDRDEWTCQDCGERRKRWGTSLHVHHIDGDKFNNRMENLVSLCAMCHRQRHR